MKSTGLWSSYERNRTPIHRLYRLEGLLLLALGLTLLLAGFATHPGVHVAGVTLLLDIMILKRERLQHIRQLILLAVLNILAILMIAFGNDTAELWLTGLYGLYTILLLVIPRPQT